MSPKHVGDIGFRYSSLVPIQYDVRSASVAVHSTSSTTCPIRIRADEDVACSVGSTEKPRRTVCSPLHLLASCCRATEVLARKNQNKLHEAFVRYGQGRLRNRQFATFEPRSKSCLFTNRVPGAGFGDKERTPQRQEEELQPRVF